jgi:hypothetical protein
MMRFDALPDDGSLRQPDQRSCAPSALVVARILLDDEYAGLVLPGSSSRFRDEVLALHRRVTRPVDTSGRLQVPWPRALGTPPWAVARQLSALGSADRPPVRYRTRLALGRAAAYGRVVAGLASGRPVVLYVGSRWLPRHVVLAVAARADGLAVYDPAPGRCVTVSREAFVEARLGLSGWDRPWFVVLPTEG